MLYVAIFSIPLFAGLLPAIFFRAREVAIVGGVALGALIVGMMASGKVGDSGSILLGSLVGIPLAALAFGIGVAVGNAIQGKTRDEPAKRMMAAAAGALVLVAGVGPVAYGAWQYSIETREAKEAAMAFVARQPDVTALIGPVTSQAVTSSQENRLATPPTTAFTLLAMGERGEALVMVSMSGERAGRKFRIEKVAAQRR